MTWMLVLLTTITSMLATRPLGGMLKHGSTAAIRRPQWAAQESRPTLSPQTKMDPVHFYRGPQYKLYKSVVHVDGKSIPVAFGVFLPRLYFETSEPLPVVIALHTRGASGADGRGRYINEELAMMTLTNGGDYRATGDHPQRRLSLHTQGRYILVMPQCPDGMKWETPPIGRIVKAELEAVIAAYSADADRVYLTGFSYGGSSTWTLALQIPNVFAAIAPIDARQTPRPDLDAKILATIPTYLSVGANDSDFVSETEHMRDAIGKIPHADFVYHVVPHGNHFCYPRVYEDADFWDWMLAHRRSGPTTAPVASSH